MHAAPSPGMLPDHSLSFPSDLGFETPVAQHRLPLLDSSPLSPRVTSFMEDLSLWLRSPLSPV